MIDSVNGNTIDVKNQHLKRDSNASLDVVAGGEVCADNLSRVVKGQDILPVAHYRQQQTEQ